MENQSDRKSVEHLFLAALLVKYPPKEGKSEELLRFLPKSEQKEKEVVLQQVSLKEQAFSWKHSLARIHYSWLAEFLKDDPSPLQVTFLRLFPKKIMNKLTSILSIETPTEFPLSESLHSFLLGLLTKKIYAQHPLPVELLPQHSLFPLLKLSNEQLHKVIDLLGMTDIAQELSTIINKQQLTKIHEFLSPLEIEYIKSHSRVKAPLKLPPIGLANWDGDKEKLRRLLHNRGIERFACCLQQQDATFIWHLVHHLDSARGKFIIKRLKTPVDPKIVVALDLLIGNILKFLLEKESHE